MNFNSIVDPLDQSKTAKVKSDSLKVAPSVPLYKSSSFIKVDTPAIGANFAAFPNTPCDALQVENNSGYDIEVKKGASDAYIRIPTYTGGRYFSGISNANELSIRRVDLSNTQLSIKAEAITV